MSLGISLIGLAGVARDGGDPDERELSRLCIIMDLRDTRLSVAAAAALLGIGRRQVFRLRQTLATAGAAEQPPPWRGLPADGPPLSGTRID